MSQVCGYVCADARRLSFAGVLVLVASSAWAQSAAGGAGHTVILKSDGTVWTVGANTYGQLGDNTTTEKKAPLQVSGLSGVVAVAAGAYHSMALTSTGNLYVWGLNNYGQIGDGTTTTPRKTPVQSSLTNVVAIAAGDRHSVALTSDGKVYTWGDDNKGQLGDGTAGTGTTSPAQVMTGVAAIAAAMEHTIFVKTNGTAYAAGENGFYQLADGTTTDRATPVQMSGISTATGAAAGERQSYVLLSDGTVKAIGYNLTAELGDGTTTTPRTSFVTVSGLSNVTAIAAGSWHVLARRSDGSVWSWGYNASGRVGDGTTTDRSTAAALSTLSSVSAVGTGADHSVAITSSGVVYTWGENGSGQLGDGTTDDRYTPTPISDAGFDWKVSTPTLSVNSGTYTANQTVTIAVLTSGATIRYTTNGNDPTESDTSITSGNAITVSVNQTVKAKAFKSGMPSSNVAVGTYELKVVTPSVSPATGTYTTTKTFSTSTTTSGATLRYNVSNDKDVAAAVPTESSTAYTGSFGVSTYSQIKVVGFKSGWTPSDPATTTISFSYGQLATPTADPVASTYVDSVTVTLSSITGATIRYTTNDTNVQSNSPAYTGPLVFEVSKTLRFKGYHNDYNPSNEVTLNYTLAAASPTFSPTAGSYVAGQLVTVTSPSSGSTVHYTINGAEPAESDPVIASGSTLVVGNYTLKAKAWKSGANASATASGVYTISGEVAPPALIAGDDHALAIRSDGVAWAWGLNSSGQVGDGTTTSPRLLPKIVSGVTGAMALSAGTNFSHILTTGGVVVGFGGNANGRLGDGTTTAHSLASAVSGLNAIVKIETGQDHGVALKGDGTVVAWGTNDNGQLGDGTTTQRLSPVAVSSLTSIAAVAAGTDFSLAVKQDGTVWAWGDNGAGQLGDDSTTDRSTAVQVEDITTATKVAAGSFHSLALLDDGSVMAWGRNVEGQLGDGTETERHTPVEVGLLSDIVAIAAGGTFSLALKDDGTVWAWGANSNGQLGDGTTTERWTAAQVPGLADIVQIAAGSAFALALEGDGSVWAWGQNGSGQIGDGTTGNNRLTPVEIAGPGMSWRVATPLLSLASGQYSTSQSVTVTINDPDAILRYTTTGVDPAASDATVTSGISLTVDVSQTLKVSGWKTGAPTSVVVARAYELKAVTPAMTPGAGAYGSAQSVSISTTTSGATIRFTTDGTEPTASSTAYSSALSVAMTQTVKARAYKTGWTASDSGYASYSVSEGTVSTPTISPAGGAQTTPPLVAITTSTTGATIRYTLDGSTPTGSSPTFVYPFLVTATTTVKAKAFKAGYTASAVASTTYDVDAAGATATPLIAPAGGMFATAQTVTITGASGATLRYTTDGTDPTTSSTSITSGNTVSVSKSQVLKVRAWASGSTESAVRRGDFLITGAIAAGGDWSYGLRSDGVLWGWGLGPIGDGTSSTRSTPVQILTGATAVAVGGYKGLAVKSDGTLWHWGISPSQVASFTGAAAVASGVSHALVLKTDGTVWAYGDNSDGQLGDGTTTNRTSPVQVVGLTGITAIAAGRESSYALQSDGAGGGIVWAWGANSFGELGDGSHLDRVTPVRVTGLPVTASRIAAIGYGAAALGIDGRVYAWGRNQYGEVGIGSTATQTSAQAVQVLTSVRMLAGGTNHVLALDAHARSWAWGLHGYHLGLGESFSTDSTLPERTDLVGALLVSGAGSHSVAAMADGTVRAFGINGGRLGDGGSSASATPVTVSGLTLADNTWLIADADDDGLETWREYFLGTDPLNRDTNGNGILDGLDEDGGMSATNPDVDADGVPNWIERVNGTDPFRADTDGDTVPDASDFYPLDPARSLPPSSNPSDTTPPIVTLKEPISAVPVP